MTPVSSGRLLAVAVIISTSAGCGPSRAATPTAGEPAVSRTRSAAEIDSIYRARIESARTRFTDADVHFMTGMIHHHAQAIEMSRLAPRNGASASIQTLAARIINAQQDEIATMQRWLRDRGQPVPEVHEMADGRVMTHGADHDHAMMDMPGMINDEQLAALRAARGRAFDRLFLTLMIEHHEGAVSMVHDLFATDGAGQDEEVFRFASDVQVDQRTEVARMELMLAALPPADAPQ